MLQKGLNQRSRGGKSGDAYRHRKNTPNIAFMKLARKINFTTLIYSPDLKT